MAQKTSKHTVQNRDGSEGVVIMRSGLDPHLQDSYRVCAICTSLRLKAFQIHNYHGIGSKTDHSKGYVCATCFSQIAHKTNGQPEQPKNYLILLNQYRSLCQSYAKSKLNYEKVFKNYLLAAEENLKWSMVIPHPHDGHWIFPSDRGNNGPEKSDTGKGSSHTLPKTMTPNRQKRLEKIWGLGKTDSKKDGQTNKRENTTKNQTGITTYGASPNIKKSIKLAYAQFGFGIAQVRDKYLVHDGPIHIHTCHSEGELEDWLFNEHNLLCSDSEACDKNGFETEFSGKIDERLINCFAQFQYDLRTGPSHYSIHDIVRGQTIETCKSESELAEWMRNQENACPSKY